MEESSERSAKSKLVFLVVIVVYNVELKKSRTLQRLFLLQSNTPEFPEILVYDNSLRAKYTEEYAPYITHYKHDPDNSGVAGAYNYALAFCKNRNYEWLILLDQDTDITQNYFDQVRKSIQKYPEANLFCPIVRSDRSIISPTWFIAEKTVAPAKVRAGLVKSKYHTIINSGIVIQVNELEALEGYDVDLYLDFSDHYFFRQYKKRNKFFVVIDCEIVHNFSSDTDKTFDTVYTRFKLYCSSAFVYAGKIGNYLPLFWLFMRTLKLTFKFLKLDFLKHFYQEFHNH